MNNTLQVETDETTTRIIDEVLVCARQTDKWRKPYAAIVAPDGTREFISHATERQDLLAKIPNLAPTYRVETRNADNCSHRYERRDIWTRIDDGWKHETIRRENRHGYCR